MILIEDDLEFKFSDALNVIKFDDCNHQLAHCMKAVDFVVELTNAYLFVEVKDPTNPKIPLCYQESQKQDFIDKTDKLKEALIKKFRDSFIYHWAEEKQDKPIHFLSLITLEEPLLNNFQDDLRKHLPFTRPARWLRPIAQSCIVINIDAWNRNFPKWPVKRISQTTQ